MSNTSPGATSAPPPHHAFAYFASAVVGYNILTILWGAWVRITGSGAGCGEHWPMCNGQVVPRTDRVETLIEMTHRLTSGVTLLLTIGVLIWALRAYPPGHRVRKGAAVACVFVLLEAALGAFLVLFGLVDKDDSGARAVVVALHLLNTFTLVGAGALTAWWASGGGPPRWRGAPGRRLLAAALIGVLLTCMTGAITALGDTLFPVDPQAGEGLLSRIQGDLDPGEHFLVRLRILHPLLASLISVLLLAWTTALRWRDDVAPQAQRWAGVLTALIVIELAAGVVNIYLAAPGWMQLVHLLLANLLWISLLLVGAATLADHHARTSPTTST